jgi:ABC-type branched-subunit amino acid transport system substrate-binding protein
MGRPGEAVWAYARAISLSDEIAAEEVRARIRYLIDDMTVESLTRLAAACPYCPEGGYARLRLARIDVAVGHLDPAEKALAELEVDFVGDLLGPIASELRQDLIARRAVQPGLYGLLLPLSGPLRLFGSRALRGALLGSGLFSELGDPDIRLAVADSQGDPEIAAQAVEGLARRGVVGIVGPLKGSAAVEAARVAGSLGIPLVALTPAPEVTKEHAFRLYLREEDEVGRLVEYAAEREQMRRFAILYPDTPLGLRYRDLFWDEVVERGGEITGVEAFSSEPGSVGEAIQRLTGVYGLTPSEIRERFLEEEGIRLRRERDLMAALGIQEDAEEDGGTAEIEIDAERLADYKPRPTVDFDGVFLPVSSLEAAQIAPQFPFRDVEGVALLGIRSWNHQALVEVGEEYVEGAIFPAEIHPEAPAARGFFAAYRGAYGEAPGVIEAYAFDAVGLLVRSSADFEDETRSTLRKRLRALWDVAGATGPLTIHPEGDIAPAPKILAVRRGRIVPVN